MPIPPSASCAYLVEADHPGLTEVAYAMFTRNSGHDADPLFMQLAWVDPEIRDFWVQQALAVRNDLERLAITGHLTN